MAPLNQGWNPKWGPETPEQLEWEREQLDRTYNPTDPASITTKENPVRDNTVTVVYHKRALQLDRDLVWALLMAAKDQLDLSGEASDEEAEVIGDLADLLQPSTDVNEVLSTTLDGLESLSNRSLVDCLQVLERWCSQVREHHGLD